MYARLWISETTISPCIFYFVLCNQFTCLALSQPKQSSYQVWHNVSNDTGWSSDVFVFMLGLINPTNIFGGLDGVIHLAENCFKPARTVPRALCSSLVIGYTTAFLFAISMSYSAKDVYAAINSRTG